MEGAKGKGKPKGKAAAAANESVLKQSRHFAFDSIHFFAFGFFVRSNVHPVWLRIFFSSRWIEEVH
jgi:hypothetical protein